MRDCLISSVMGSFIWIKSLFLSPCISCFVNPERLCVEVWSLDWFYTLKRVCFVVLPEVFSVLWSLIKQAPSAAAGFSLLSLFSDDEAKGLLFPPWRRGRQVFPSSPLTAGPALFLTQPGVNGVYSLPPSSPQLLSSSLAPKQADEKCSQKK